MKIRSSQGQHITFYELAKVKFGLIDEMRYHFLVKTHDLKNQSLQQDDLSCLRNC